MKLTIDQSELNDVVAVDAIYEDYAAARCDALQLLLFDEQGKLNSLQKGMVIEASQDNIKTGRMYISNIAYKGQNILVRAVSMKTDYLEERSTFREQISFKEVVDEITKETGCVLHMKDIANCIYIELNRVQKNPIKYLAEILGMEGFSLKINNDTLYIFDERKQERKDPVKTVDENDFLEEPEHNTSDSGMIELIRNTYNNQKSSYVIDTIVKSGKMGRKLQTSIAVDSIGQSERITKNLMRDANKYEYTTVGKLDGLELKAGQNIELLCSRNFFEGKNYIYKIQHDLLNEKQKIYIRKVEE